MIRGLGKVCTTRSSIIRLLVSVGPSSVCLPNADEACTDSKQAKSESCYTRVVNWRSGKRCDG